MPSVRSGSLRNSFIFLIVQKFIGKVLWRVIPLFFQGFLQIFLQGISLETTARKSPWISLHSLPEFLAGIILEIIAWFNGIPLEVSAKKNYTWITSKTHPYFLNIFSQEFPQKVIIKTLSKSSRSSYRNSFMDFLGNYFKRLFMKFIKFFPRISWWRLYKILSEVP